MNRQSAIHLNYDQLLQALVDKSDLGDDARMHLETCSGCQQQVARLVQRYDRLGTMAREMVPDTGQPFRVPEQSVSRKRWQFKPAMALGIIGAMILVLTVWWPRQFESPNTSNPVVAQNSESDDVLMAEIDALVADALPAAYQEMAGVSDSQSIEDLIEWIVPSIEEEEGFEPRA